MCLSRYSVPVITTKFRLRIVHCCSSHYRCCILFVWCLVILFISLGIVGTVIFGGTATTGSGKYANGTTIPRTGNLANRTANMMNYVHNNAIQGG